MPTEYEPSGIDSIKQFILEELTTEEDIEQFLLAYKRISDTQTSVELLNYEGKKPPYVRFFVIKNVDQIVTTATLETSVIKGEKCGWLSMLAVDKNYRGRGLAKQLTDARTKAARHEDCSCIYTNVFTNNPIGLATKFNDGYILTDLEFYDDKSTHRFVMYKKIESESRRDRKNDALGELTEIQLSDLSAIKRLLNQGWIGIDIKNIGDEKNNDPKRWKLIMEQTTK